MPMYELAAFVRTGGGGERRDEKRGLELLRRAAESPRAVTEAMRDFGIATYFGQYSDLSDVRAGQPMTPQQVRRMETYQQDGARWVKRAADAGDQESIVFYATWSACGVGVKKDVLVAEKMLIDTADRGSVRAMQELAEFFASGRCGMRRDASAAEQWRRSAEAAQSAPKKP
jgi:TPR repeat protein